MFHYFPLKTFPNFYSRGHYNVCTLLLKFLKLLIVLFVLYLFPKADQFSESNQLNRGKATSHFLENLKRKSEDNFAIGSRDK